MSGCCLLQQFSSTKGSCSKSSSEERAKRVRRHCLSRWQRQPGASSAAVGVCGTIPREQHWDIGRPSCLGGPAHPGDTFSGVVRCGSSLVDVHMQVLHGMNTGAGTVAGMSYPTSPGVLVDHVSLLLDIVLASSGPYLARP